MTERLARCARLGRGARCPEGANEGAIGFFWGVKSTSHLTSLPSPQPPLRAPALALARGRSTGSEPMVRKLPLSPRMRDRGSQLRLDADQVPAKAPLPNPPLHLRYKGGSRASAAQGREQQRRLTQRPDPRSCQTSPPPQGTRGKIPAACRSPATTGTRAAPP